MGSPSSGCDRAGRGSENRTHPGRILSAVVAFAVCLAVIALPLGGCAAQRVIDKFSVTQRGVAVLNDISEKSGEGYDVRDARAKWLEALQAYQKGDYQKTAMLLDQVDGLLDKSTKVAERVFYESAGGITVSGLLFKPPGEGPWPTVIVNHAGFGTAADFSDVALIIRDKGYLVLNPDFRGSGESEGEHELAKGEVDDVINGIKYLKERGMVDDDRVALYGQSHGAAVSMLAAERYPGIKAVVEEAGPSDAVGIYQVLATSKIPAGEQLYKQLLEMVGGTPDQVPYEYYIRSPINFVKDMNAPVLLIHGAKDPLIPVDQAYSMYDALRAAGKTAELKVYPNEAHCVSSPAGRLEVWELMFQWFKKYGV